MVWLVNYINLYCFVSSNRVFHFHHIQNIPCEYRKSDPLFNYNVGDVGIEPTMPEATVLQTASPPWRISPLVPQEGLEPSRLTAHEFESCVSANFTIRAYI